MLEGLKEEMLDISKAKNKKEDERHNELITELTELNYNLTKIIEALDRVGTKIYNARN